MKQSQSYRRGQKGNFVIDPNSYNTYRIAVAGRIIRRRRGWIKTQDAWQLAAIPAFFHWLFRKPVSFFKTRKMRRAIDKKIKSNSNPRSSE